MFPSSWALAVRPKIWAVDGVGPISVFAAQQWRTLSTKLIGDREKYDSEFFDIKPTTLMSITMIITSKVQISKSRTFLDSGGDKL